MAVLPVGSLTAQEKSEAAYGVSVGEIAVTHHAANDFWSRPDLMVRVRRQDPVVLDRVFSLDNRLRELKTSERAARERMRPLRMKRKAAAVVPGASLTAAQVDRLAALGEVEGACVERRDSGECARCSPYDERAPCPACARCKELAYLTERKAASETLPGERLTEEEARELDLLETTASDLEGAISRARTERARLLSTITGYTRSIETDRTVVNFNHEWELLEVFPGDALEVAVLDDDMSEDDLYGRTVIVATGEVLDAGELELRMPNVRYVRLRFRRSASVANAE